MYLLTKQNAVLPNLPKINTVDPMAKFIGAKPNQIIKIESFNPTTGISLYYRLCVKDLSNS